MHGIIEEEEMEEEGSDEEAEVDETADRWPRFYSNAFTLIELLN